MSKFRALLLTASISLLAATASAPDAQAACKRGLTNYKDLGPGYYFKVVTNWCYRNGNVTSRRSRSYERPPPYFAVRSRWMPNGKGVGCNAFNGYPTHNCLTRREYRAESTAPGAGFPTYYYCIQTRIYGNGAHKRLITDGRCP